MVSFSMLIITQLLNDNLLGLHLRGKISLGTTYAKGTVANPIPINIWAPISR